jgi:hypothetical protein
MLRQGQVERLLNRIRLTDPAPLVKLLADSIAPVQHLFAKVGADFPATL